MIIVVLGIGFLALLFLTFRSPDAPKLDRLLYFLLLLAVAGAMGYFFLINVLHYNPNPAKVRLSQVLTEHKLIDLGEIVPGVFDHLDYVHRVDTDGEPEESKEEWLVFYQYDVQLSEQGVARGPYGAAIYDHDDCRPPAIQSFELVPASYDYLGEDWTYIYDVANIIPYADPISRGLDRLEVIIAGSSRGVVTDLNIFRKVGVTPSCMERQAWARDHDGQPFRDEWQLRYANVGSFRGSYKVSLAGSTVTVLDRGGFERSQFTVRRQYTPVDGFYFRPGTQVLLDPVEYSLGFGPGQPDEISQVYYPEKAVLAFYLALGKDKERLERAESYLSEVAKARYDIESDQFGVAMPRGDLARVLVWEIRYDPDIAAEQAHEPRTVTLKVVGVDKDGNWHEHPARLVTWRIVGVDKPGALPYGCEWRLDEILSAAAP